MSGRRILASLDELRELFREVVAPLVGVVPLLLRADEAARYLGISRATLYRLRESGELLPSDVPGLDEWRWHVDDLNAFAQRCRPVQNAQNRGDSVAPLAAVSGSRQPERS